MLINKLLFLFPADMQRDQAISLYLLCAVQFFERFGFYALRILLILYCIASRDVGGLGWSEHHSLAFNGIYFCLLHIQPLLGGWIADRWIGQKVAVIVGQLLLASGYFLLACGKGPQFYIGLIGISMGYGLFKPSLASLVGSLFPCKDHLRDYAFSILYISVTLGIFTAGVIGGWFENENTLPLVFFVSGIFVVISLLLFLLSLKWQNSIAEPEVSNSLNQNSSEPLSEQEKSHVKFLAILAIFAIMFYAAHNEGGALLSIYLKRYTDRVVGGVEIPAPWFTAWGAFLTTLLTIGINRIWRLLDEYKKEPPLIYKIAFGLSCTGLSFIVLALAAWYTHPSITNKTPIYWILIFQIIFVFAKACVNPLLWSATSRLAPKRYHSLYMGLMLGCISLGHLLGGGINSYITQIGYEGLFLLTSILMITASSLLALLKPYLTSLVDYKGQVNRK